MHTEEVLVLAMTRMLSGICTAGLTRRRGADGRLQWLRPVREFDTLLPGDMTEASGRLIQCWDVVQFHLTSSPLKRGRFPQGTHTGSVKVVVS